MSEDPSRGKKRADRSEDEDNRPAKRCRWNTSSCFEKIETTAGAGYDWLKEVIDLYLRGRNEYRKILDLLKPGANADMSELKKETAVLERTLRESKAVLKRQLKEAFKLIQTVRNCSCELDDPSRREEDYPCEAYEEPDGDDPSEADDEPDDEDQGLSGEHEAGYDHLEIIIKLYLQARSTYRRFLDLISAGTKSHITEMRKAMIEAIKHSIIQLQISKENLKHPVLMNGSLHDGPLLTDEANFSHYSSAPCQVMSSLSTENVCRASQLDKVHLSTQTSISLPKLSYSDDSSPLLTEEIFPATSYSSSEDEEFYDAEDQKSPKEPNLLLTAPAIRNANLLCEGMSVSEPGKYAAEDNQGDNVQTAVISAEEDYFDDMPSPKERMVQVVRWYQGAFHAGRPSEIAKKPYNPILGETFNCHWHIPEPYEDTDVAADGPIPWAKRNDLVFISEQISHHPAISAFYAENYNKHINLDGYIWTKSKFLGLSFGVHMIGECVLSVLDHDEEYTLSFPSGYGRLWKDRRQPGQSPEIAESENISTG